jgi:hypothetical protein
LDSIPVVTAPVGERRADVVQVCWLRIGQRLEQDGVQRAEDGRGGADAERERHDGGERKRRRSAIAAQGEP